MWTWKADRPVAVIVIIHGASEYHGRYKWLIEMWRSRVITLSWAICLDREQRQEREGIFARFKNTLMK